MKVYLTLLTLYFLLFSVPCFCQADNIQSLETFLPAVKDSIRYVDVLNRIAMLSYEADADSTAFYGNKARGIAGRIGYAQGGADATNCMGVAAHVQGDFQTALRYYSDAYNQYCRIQDSANIAQTLMNIAMVYGSSGKPEKAVERYRQAYDIGNRLAHDSILSLIIYNYILQFPGEFTPASTAANIEKAIGVAAKYHDGKLLLAIQQLKANKLIDAGKRDSGIALLQYAADEGVRSGFYYLSLDILLELGDLFVHSDSARSIGYYREALAITEEKKFRSYERDITQKLFDFYSSRKDTGRAFAYSSKLLKAYRGKDESDKKQGFDYIDYALKDQQLITERQNSAYRTRLLWLACIACVMAIAITLILWFNAKRRRRTHVLLQKQYASLEVISESLEKRNVQYARLLKIVAHDLRNPIGAIHSASDMMQKAEKQDVFLLKMVNDSSNRCLQLIRELLETDFEVKPDALHKSATDVSVFLQDTVELLAFKAKEKRQILEVKADSDLTLNIDREQIRRVIENLVINAMKFSPEAAVILVTAGRKGEDIVIAVRDEGIGIPSAMAKHLFDPFTSAKRKGTAGEQTYGLGLYISKQIVEAHGGEIWFESEEGMGSTFFVKLQQ